MSTPVVRRVPKEDLPEFARTVETCFGMVATEDEVKAIIAEDVDEEWAIGAYDDGRLVATAAATVLELTLPAPNGQPLPTLPVAGITCVGVLPSHRRRGLLTQMMAYQLDQLRERELKAAVLTASESAIYGRFGYGLSTSYQSLSITTKRSAFQKSTDLDLPDAGGFRVVGVEEAKRLLPHLHAEAVRLRPGEIMRSEPRWEALFEDRERDRRGGGPRLYVVHESPGGAPDGYATYRYHRREEGPWAAHRVVVVEDLYALSTSTHAKLWRFLLDLDLVAELNAYTRPLDEPLRWMLADPRQLGTMRQADTLWTKLIDVPAALCARGYSAELELVLQVTGTGSEGRQLYRLETSSTGGQCRRITGSSKPDLVLGLAELGAVYLGGCAPSVLAAAGRIREPRPGALARADLAFSSPLAPFCGTSF